MTGTDVNQPLLPALPASPTQGEYGAANTTDKNLETTEKHELAFLVKSSIPVTITFVLEYLLNATTIFVVAHLGTDELAAASLVSVTVGVAGYAVIIGVSTCLDTLAAQSYGRGDFAMVGLHSQRCALFLFMLCIPITIGWIFSKPILSLLVPQENLTEMAAQCLQIYALGLPGFIIFEVSKHYLQVQGIFHAPTYILCICTPINVLLNYLLVWHKTIGMGLMGAPVAVCITDTLMAIASVCYIVYVDGSQCWTPITRDAWKGWGKMIRFAFAGVIMVEAEWLAFDFLTMLSSQFGTNVLAAQSIMSTITTMGFQIPLSIGIACSTRVGNLIGAGASRAAKIAGNVGLKASLAAGALNASVMYLGRYQLGKIFTSDEKVLAVVASVLPLAALFQFNDSLGAITGGILRGQGRQWIGGVVNVVFYYCFMVPCAYTFAFTLGWGLQGLWSGMVIGLCLVSGFQLYFVKISNWDAICQACNEEPEHNS